MSRAQLLALGLSPRSIHHRVSSGRLHPVWRGVYALGRPELSRRGIWMAAVLRCGRDAALSHASAAALWEIGSERGARIDLSVPGQRAPRASGITVHRRRLTARDLTRRHHIPVTTPTRTLIDLAASLPQNELEAAISEADKRSLTDPERIRAELERIPKGSGTGVMRSLLDRRTFRLTDSELERRFLPVARAAGLPPPETGQRLNGFKVDFFWPELGLVVETDGLRYHRTPAQQARDRLRDQAHTASGLTMLRFTHAQVRFEPGYVRSTLAKIRNHLRGQRSR